MKRVREHICAEYDRLVKDGLVEPREQFAKRLKVIKRTKGLYEIQGPPDLMALLKHLIEEQS